MVYCVKLQREGTKLGRPPFPGELGERIYNNISREAWAQWLAQQTILINEYHLSPIDPQARQFLDEQLIEFLFEQKDNTEHLVQNDK